MIKCSECGHDVSDKADKCPYCGAPIEMDSKIAEKDFETTAADIDSKANKKSKKKKIIIIAAVVFVVAIVGIALGINAHNEQMAKNYSKDLSSYTVNALMFGIKCEDVCNTTTSVWYNCISEESDKSTNKYTQNSNGVFYDDFNDALEKWFMSDKYSDKLSEIEKEKDSLDSLYNRIKAYDLGSEEELTALSSLKEQVGDFYQLTTDPNGSYSDYLESFSMTDRDFNSKYDSLDSLIN